MQGNGGFRLVVRRGPQPNQTYELNKDIVTLGRDITNDIVINDPEVSRHHCRLTRTPSGYTYEDLGSTNGSFVNGQRLTGARPLVHGDMIGLGETVTLGYEGGAVQAPGMPQETVIGSTARPPSYAPPAAAPVEQPAYGVPQPQPQYGAPQYSMPPAPPFAPGPPYQGPQPPAPARAPILEEEPREYRGCRHREDVWRSCACGLWSPPRALPVAARPP
jgi:hypothetical protein